MKRIKTQTITLLTLITVLSVLTVVPNFAQGARTTGANVSTRSSPNNVSVFATGLNNPRGLKFGPDGNHYGEMYHQH